MYLKQSLQILFTRIIYTTVAVSTSADMVPDILVNTAAVDASDVLGTPKILTFFYLFFW